MFQRIQSSITICSPLITFLINLDDSNCVMFLLITKYWVMP
jgi:hypothetical protein